MDITNVVITYVQSHYAVHNRIPDIIPPEYPRIPHITQEYPQRTCEYP